METCHKPEPLDLSLFFHINNVFWKFIPWLISIGFTVNVLWFAFKDKMRQERETWSKKQSNPQTEHEQIPTLSSQVSQREIELENIEDHPDVEEYPDLGENMIPEYEILDVPEILNSGKCQENESEKYKIIRKNSVHDMFFKVVIKEEQEAPTSCFTFLNLSLEVLAKVIKEYVQVIVIQMCLLPIAFLNFYFFFTDRQPLGDDLMLLRISRGICVIVFMVLYFLLSLLR